MFCDIFLFTLQITIPLNRSMRFLPLIDWRFHTPGGGIMTEAYVWCDNVFDVLFVIEVHF